MLTRCGQIMRDVCAGPGAELREFNGEHDHVHLLARYPPKLPVSTLVNRLKGTSAHYLREDARTPAASTATSCTGTSGPRPTSPHPAARRR
jgi:REP element-mobilizing transposase RayT